MEQNKLENYISENARYFPDAKLELLKEKMLEKEELKYADLSSVDIKEPAVMRVISVAVGMFGIDRFILGDKKMGLVKLCTLGGLGILWIYDWFQTAKKTRENNLEKILSIL